MRPEKILRSQIFLALAGLGISVYLTWVYMSDSIPICFGDGGCSTVQHSSYAHIMGIPVPALGMVAYVTLLALVVLALRVTEWGRILNLAIFGIALVGVLFSAYLTYLEFFVIHAVCYWCLGSAVVMLLFFGLSVAQQKASA